MARHGTRTELAQSLIKPCFFGWYSADCAADDLYFSRIFHSGLS
jgi:hypothetical protein